MSVLRLAELPIATLRLTASLIDQYCFEPRAGVELKDGSSILVSLEDVIEAILIRKQRDFMEEHDLLPEDFATVHWQTIFILQTT